MQARRRSAPSNSKFKNDAGETPLWWDRSSNENISHRWTHGRRNTAAHTISGAQAYPRHAPGDPGNTNARRMDSKTAPVKLPEARCNTTSNLHAGARLSTSHRCVWSAVHRWSRSCGKHAYVINTTMFGGPQAKRAATIAHRTRHIPCLHFRTDRRPATNRGASVATVASMAVRRKAWYATSPQNGRPCMRATTKFDDALHHPRELPLRC